VQSLLSILSSLKSFINIINIDIIIITTTITGREGKVITIVKEEENFVINRYSNALGKDITERKLNLKKK
jgi:hypothetical protein